MSTTLRLDLRFLTPAFLGGAGPAAELRPPSFKGLLRQWLRAVDPHFRDRETHLFGGAGAGAGQSRVLLRVVADSPKLVRWDTQRAQKYTKGSGTHSINGIVYLGYPFQLRGNDERTALDAGTKFTLLCVLPRGLGSAEPEKDRRALLAALWTFSTFGSMGMRSRRGFGSLALESWSAAHEGPDSARQEAWQSDMTALPVLHKDLDAATWEKHARAGLATLRQWLGDFPANTRHPPRHPHLGPAARWRLSREAFRDTKDWQTAIDHAGRQLQTFRQRLGPDYSNVKDHMRIGAGERGAAIKTAPERVAFGMPLAFRFSSLRVKVKPALFVPHGRSSSNKPLERHPSPLLLKLVQLSDGLHSLWLRLDGPRPGTEPRAVERESRDLLVAPTRDLVGEFLDNPDVRMER